MQDPTMSVFHSHGLKLAKAAAQLKYWTTLNTPQAFSRQRLARFRPDLG